MPNWCDNSVLLTNSDKSKIDALDAELSKKSEGHYGSQGQLLNFLRPNPTGEWEYNWSIENWGTKWDAHIIDWERRDDNEIWVSFESAWSPPTTLYEYIVEQGWGVEALYYEPGMGYAGQFTTDGGDDYYEYDLSDPDSIEDLPEDVIDFGDLRTKAKDHIIYMLEDEWADAERTEWYPMTTTPVRGGYYEVQVKGYEDRTFVEFAKYDELLEWDYWNTDNLLGWRGLAKNPEEIEE